MRSGIDAEAAQKALRERPSISIRARIIIAFLSLLVISVMVSIASLVIVSRIEKTMSFLRACENYAFEVQQARRYEKNYFLYGTNLGDALESIQSARRLLESEGEDISAVVGAVNFELMVRHERRYEDLIKEIIGLPRGEEQGERKRSIELELREHGTEMISVAGQLLGRERQRVEAMLKISKQVPLGFIVVLLVLVTYTVHFLSRQMLKPLNRFVNYTQRIARGDFSPITPAKRYRDEFSDLAMAINLMLDRLKRHEEQLLQSRKMAAIGNLTSGIAHELNNPLNNISLTVETLLDDSGDMPLEEKRKLLDDISSQTERASATVRNLLDFTRMDRPSNVLHDIGEIIAPTLRLVKHEAELSDVALKTDVPMDLPRLRGDFKQLQQVFINLFLNSIQAMPKGGVLEVRACREGNMLRVDVADTGQGIPESDLPHIFDPFFTTKKVGEGTGLGLSVSFGIIKKHGGNITVGSRLNEGTTFGIYLPLEDGKHDGTAAQEEGPGEVRR